MVAGFQCERVHDPSSGGLSWRALDYRRDVLRRARYRVSLGGREYHFLGRAFGRYTAFLYGWARLTVIVAGSIAVFAYLFGDYMSRVIHLGPQSSAIWAALVVAILTAVNYVGIREGKLTQNFFTFLECGGLVLIVHRGILSRSTGPGGCGRQSAGGETAKSWYEGAGLAMIFVLFTYGGWNDAAIFRRRCATASATWHAPCSCRSAW